MAGGRRRAGRGGRATAAVALFGSAMAALVMAPLAAGETSEQQAAWEATVAAVQAVELTPAGYRAFRRGVDERHVPFAQRHADFNPRRVDVSQGPSRVFVWHYTLQYFNRDGAALKPVGRASPRRLVSFMAGRTGVCCGINWFIDRDARVFRLTPLNAKLRHNPPYDSVVTGVEVEAGAQELVTTEQYEQLAYLTIHVLRRQEHLPRTDPLRQVVRGHGEMRDAYLERRPQAQWDEKDDFDEPVSRLLRHKIQQFLDARAAAAVTTSRRTAAIASAGDPFAGAGTWVSIFMDTWDSPREHVRRMHERGVTTLYLQTSSSKTPVNQKVFQRAKVGRFIDAAHARGMKVVAWYLPPLANVPAEYDRAMAAIRFRSDSGQRFDGFALDIEPTARTPDVPQRNENLLRLSRRIRRSAPTAYPLAAIIPSPVGLRRSAEFWPQFPYAGIGRSYDTIVPMSYHTYRAEGAAATYEYTRKNIAILRRHYGPDARIHIIGGEADVSDGRETRAFVRAANDAGVLGASLWHYGMHEPHDWDALRRLDSATADPV